MSERIKIYLVLIAFAVAYAICSTLDYADVVAGRM